MKLWIFLLLFYGILPQGSTAQQWGFESFGIENGLPASETYNMFQDDKGYIFIATEYGMVKYNGNRFVPVCNNIPLRERVAYAFCKRSNGEYCFINSQFHFYTIRNDSAFALRIAGKSIPIFPHNAPVKQIFIDSVNNVYAGSPNANYLYKAASNKWIVFDQWDTLRKDHRENPAVIAKINGSFFSSSCSQNSNRIIIRNTAYAGEYRLPERLPGRVRYMVKENNQGIYLLGQKKLIQITREKKVHTYTASGDPLTLNFSADGHIWLGLHYTGLVELDSNLRPVHHYLDHLSIADILFDRQQGVWLTSLEQGVYHCKNIHEYRYDHIEGCAGEIRFMKVVNDKLFAGTVNGKLLAIGPEETRVIGFGDYSIQDVISWQNGYLVAAKKCIFSLDTAFHTSSTNQYQTSSYLLLAQGENFLSMGSTSLALFSTRHVLQQELFLPSKITCLLPLGGDSMLAGCTKGLFLIRNNRMASAPDLYPLRNCNISDIKQGKDGTIWIGTKGDGLLLLSPDKRLKKIPTPSGIITHISFFKDSIILLSTNIGLYTGRYHSATPEWNNLYNGEIMNALSYHNKIFIGTKHGLVSYDTGALFKPLVFPVYLSSVTASGRNVNIDDIWIQPGERDLRFSFDMLSYNRPAAPLFYRLRGPLSSEGQVAGTQLFLQNLKPGQYILNIHIGSTAKQPVLIVPFYVKPAFWQTNTFLAACIGAGLFLLLTGAYLLYWRARSITNKKAAIRRMLSEYKLTALKAQINPHFMSNSLAAIQQLMLSNETDKASRYLALFSLLIRHVLQYSDKSLVSLSDELKIIELNVSLEQLRFSDQFIFETELAPDIDPQVLSIPPLITQPFIENAIWHGLLPLKGQRRPRLLLRVRREQEQVIVSVIDNGVGRKTHQGQNHYRDAAFASRGLGLTQSRIENLNQLYPGEPARLEITDLYDGTMPAGTQIDIILPYIPNPTYDNPYPEPYHR